MTTDRRHEERRRAQEWFALLVGDDSAATGDAPVLLPLLSGSMAPDLPLGTTLVVQPGSWRETRDGDIVVFRRGGNLVAHRRLLGVGAGGWGALYQKGDAVRTGGWIAPHRIVGRAVALRHADGAEVALDTPDMRVRGLRRARRSLWQDLRARLRAALGRVP